MTGAALQLEASPTPRSPFRRGRQIGVHFSDYAAVRAPQPFAWRWMFGPTPAEAKGWGARTAA